MKNNNSLSPSTIYLVCISIITLLTGLLLQIVGLREQINDLNKNILLLTPAHSEIRDKVNARHRENMYE